LQTGPFFNGGHARWLSPPQGAAAAGVTVATAITPPPVRSTAAKAIAAAILETMDMDTGMVRFDVVFMRSVACF
jgi:hypothetical protein